MRPSDDVEFKLSGFLCSNLVLKLEVRVCEDTAEDEDDDEERGLC